jgi:hypothetical protein
VDGIQLTNIGRFNLALCTVNLAESAGISATGITHKMQEPLFTSLFYTGSLSRASIYLNAAISAKLSLPRIIRGVVAAYFFRRAKFVSWVTKLFVTSVFCRRHVGKSISLESSNMNSVNWIFHPLARKFVRDPKALRAIFQKYQGPTSTDNFPFSSTEIARLYIYTFLSSISGDWIKLLQQIQST